MEVPVPPADNTRLAGLSEAVNPLDEDTAVKVTVPVNPPRLARLIVEVEVDPARKVTVDGLAAKL